MTETLVSSKGQVVIPKKIREKYGLKPGQRLRVIPHKEGILLKPSLPTRELRGLMKEAWKGIDLGEIIKRAKKTLFKGV
ncbi:MAG: AbrB/MazE/SpoVT family DNA-binding domain-containing protein [Euryarchaeota archaeon]|nr:AbrB/MazE/SpoVT family DNA-binding domain-containing protein [Euryarchaeota archaeon]